MRKTKKVSHCNRYILYISRVIMVGTGITALMFAVGKGMEEIAQLLIDNGADINLQNIDGLTALQIAVGIEKLKMVELLIAAGAGGLYAFDPIIVALTITLFTSLQTLRPLHENIQRPKRYTRKWFQKTYTRAWWLSVRMIKIFLELRKLLITS